jgi:hypothetical protein
VAKKHVKKDDPKAKGIVTSYTRTGTLDLTNRKPFRTARQKEEARRTAEKVDGTWKSSAPKSFHPEFKG